MTTDPFGPYPDAGEEPGLPGEPSQPDPRVSLRRLVALVVVVAFILALALAVDNQAERERPASLERLTENFEQMVFSEQGGNGGGRLHLWRQPVGATLIGESASAWQAKVEGLMAEFQALAGVRFSLAQPARANLRIEFSREAFERSAVRIGRPEGVQCVATTADGAATISGARVLIPDDLPPSTTEKCLLHELMHAIGFRGHPFALFPSGLSNEPRYRTLTINDRILIRTLYDPRLEHGMPREPAMATARTIIAELLDRLSTADDVALALARP